MNAAGRLFMDVSYTRTQHGSVGVTRTVRRLLESLQESALLTELTCQPVVIHSRGFSELPQSTVLPSATIPPKAANSIAAHTLRWAAKGRLRSVALSFLPVHWLHAAWRLYTRWTFDTLSRHAPTIEFKVGDVLLLCDASWHYEAWDAAQKARHQGARVILMVYDLIPLRHPEFCAQLVSCVFRRWLAEMVSASDAVVCISAAVEEDLRDYAKMTGLPLPQTGHFRLGCDPIREVDSGNSVRPLIANFLDTPVACFAAVGSFELRKNYAWLLHAFEQMWAKGNNIRLLIVGRPTTDGQTLINKMKQHPEQGHKLLTVFDAHDTELAYVYEKCRALLFPSLAEGFGLPLVEARTRGCHVIASNLPIFLELKDEGVSLYQQNSFKELETLVMEHGKIDRPAPKTAMTTFTWNDSAKDLLRVIDQLLEEPWKT